MRPYLTVEKHQHSTKMVECSKKTRGQFYTTRCDYILSGLGEGQPWKDAAKIVEPFAGSGDLIAWVRKQDATVEIEGWDIDPKGPGVKQRDTLLDPPDYRDAWVITNPPYLARNKCADKTVFDLYDSNDLYKCFIMSLCASSPRGGILIIPAGFFLSPRDVDARCREAFMSKFRITRIKYFEETVFDDTTTTVVAVAWERSPGPLEEQEVPWSRFPSGETRVFTMQKSLDWIIGGDIYRLRGAPGVTVSRHVQGQAPKKGVSPTFLTLHALDSGTAAGGRIALVYEKGVIYPAKDCSRTFATLCVSGRPPLTESEQISLAERFNALVEAKRDETWSLFLPQYRESKEYARKRIPFELAYSIVEHLLA